MRISQPTCPAMGSNVAQGVSAPLARMALLHERNVQLGKEIDDLQTQISREMAMQGVALPSTPTGYSEPGGRLQDLKRIIKYFNKKSPAWRIQILKRRALLKHRRRAPDSDEGMHDNEGDQESTDDELQLDDNRLPVEGEAIVKQVKHELVYGGDIVDDIEAIQYAEEMGMQELPEFKADFASAYDLSFDLAIHIVKTSPVGLLNTFNILASIREYPRWQKSEAHTDKMAIEEMATLIIDAALLIPEAHRPALFGPNGVLENKHRCMQEIYLHRIIGIRR